MADIKFESNDDILKAAKSVGAIAGIICLLFGVLYATFAWKQKRQKKLFHAKDLTIGLSLGAGVGITWFLFFDDHPLYWIDLIHSSRTAFLCSRLGWMWALSLAASIIVMPALIFYKKKTSPGLRTGDFKNVSPNWKFVKKVFYKGIPFPVGVDVKSLGTVVLSELERYAHFFCIGATGSGKSNLMLLMIIHDIWQGRPCIIIDPKSDDSTLDELRRLAKLFNIDLDKRLKVFDLSRPEVSCRYNPLKHGKASWKKDRLMEALNWSEEYYRTMAGSYLTALTGCTEYLQIPLTLDYVQLSITDEKTQTELMDKLEAMVVLHDVQAKKFYTLLGSCFSKSNDVLSSLAAQISMLNSPDFGHLFSFTEHLGSQVEIDEQQEIDLHEIRRSGGIAFFKLSILGSADTGRRTGRMVIEDLKGLAQHILATERDESKRVFCPVYIDEFGSFATKEFIEMMKQCRSAHLGLHLFCQGFEDLDTISKEFRRQVVTNSLTKGAFRVDDMETANEFCSVAGTFDALEQSHQVDDSGKTGRGNLRETKQMMVEHDVIKNLCRGEAVIISKSPTKVFGIQVCHTKIL